MSLGTALRRCSRSASSTWPRSRSATSSSTVAAVATGAAALVPGWTQAGLLRLACQQGPPVREEP
jgi:hypothetical protein